MSIIHRQANDPSPPADVRIIRLWFQDGTVVDCDNDPPSQFGWFEDDDFTIKSYETTEPYTPEAPMIGEIERLQASFSFAETACLARSDAMDKRPVTMQVR